MTKEETAKELKRLGSRRRKAIEAQKAAEAEIRPLLPVAIEEGIPLRTLRDMTGLSVGTIRLWVAEAS
ncbi:hypothetical protein ACWDU8_34895 [Streptomyces sp. NPDC003388]